MTHKKEQKRYARAVLLLIVLVGLVLIVILPPIFRKAAPQKQPALEKIKPVIARVEEAQPKYAIDLVKSFPFSGADSLGEWENKIFKGKVAYSVEQDKPQSYVRAQSNAAASALYYKIDLDPSMVPVMRWKWRVDKFPEKNLPENLETEKEHDFAARVYVIFPTMFILNSKVIEYIWAKDLPAGSTGISPYSKNIRLMVLESGPTKDGQWHLEERDVLADYMKLFGKSPERDIGAVAFMTNAEHTGTTASAVYDEIEIGYKKDKSGKGRL